MKLFTLPGPFTPESGLAYCTPVPDGMPEKGSQVFVFLYEDDRLLGSIDSPHETIRCQGRGTFSVWGATLYLSASDNTDPGTNGRSYRMVVANLSPSDPVGLEMRGRLTTDDVTVLKMVAENAGISNSVFSNYFGYRDGIMRPLTRNGLPLPRSILEVGCGAVPYTGLRFLADGVVRFVANDVQSVTRTFGIDLVNALSRCLEVLSPDVAWRLAAVLRPSGDGTVYEARGLTVIDQCPCEEIDIGDPVEFITSTSVLEHVTKPVEVLAAFRRFLIPGGLMWHSIDLRDHRDFSRPLAFLSLTEEEYEKKSENRLRASDWLRLLERVGFEVIEAYYHMWCLDGRQIWAKDEAEGEPIVTDDHRARFVAPFNSYGLHDLSTIAVQLLCRKR